MQEKIEARIDAIFASLSQGHDVAPATVFRTEGWLQALCDTGHTSPEQVCQIMLASWEKLFESHFPGMQGEVIRIPTQMKRAPVYPSTK